MRLLHLKVTDFRALRDVDLTFDASFTPAVFPLGSQNGGGKSTLLQLLFVLLRCSGVPVRRKYIRNLLSSFAHPAVYAEKHVATIVLEVEDETGPIELEFISLSDRFITDKLATGDDANLSFAALAARKKVTKKKTLPNTQAERLKHLLAAQDYLYITWFSEATNSTACLVCRSSNKASDQLLRILQRIRNRIFLLGPSTQQYLFLPGTVRRALNAHPEEDEQDDNIPAPRLQYQQLLLDTEDRIGGFHGYDWLSVDALLQLFRKVRDQDFAQAVEDGEYGEHYPSTLADVNSLLHRKRVKPHPDLSDVTFTLDIPGQQPVTLGLEDLSRGELKRLMLYAWIRAMDVDEALVLIDEVEISFHPDWQAGIVADLIEWGPGHQYILATHSYEVCEALTPAHVRELDPPLTPRSSDPQAAGD